MENLNVLDNVVQRDGTLKPLGEMGKNDNRYSTDETIIGIYTDGSKIYRKVMVLDNVNIVVDTNLELSYGIEGISRVLDVDVLIDGCKKNSISWVQNNNTYYYRIDPYFSQVLIRTNVSSFAGQKQITIILTYTKTEE